MGHALAPALLDRYLARTGYDSQQTGEFASPDRPDNLWQPADGPGGSDFGATGEFIDRAHDRSLQLWLSQHSRAAAAWAGAMALAGGALAAGAARRR